MQLRVWALAGLVVLATVLQTSLVPFLQVSEVRPDLLLVLSLAVGLTFGPREAGWIGAAAGLCEDFLSGRQVGLFTASLALVSYLMALAGQKVYREHVAVPVMAGFVGTWMLHVVEATLSLVGGIDSNWHLMGLPTLLEAGANAVLTGLAYGPVRRLEGLFSRGGRYVAGRRPGAWL